LTVASRPERSGEGDGGVAEVLAEEALSEGFEVFAGFGEGKGASAFGEFEFEAGGLGGDPDLADRGVGGDDKFTAAILEDDVHDAVVVLELERAGVVFGGDEGLLERFEGQVGFAAEGGFVDHGFSLQMASDTVRALVVPHSCAKCCA
jgi:hypothetical protein